MFALCATELESRNNTEWCSLQTEDEREIINYAQDLSVCMISYYNKLFSLVLGFQDNLLYYQFMPSLYFHRTLIRYIHII